MNAENSYGLILIGLCIRYLTNTQGEAVKNQKKHLSFLDEELERAGFEVSQAGMEVLAEARKQLESLEDDDIVDEKLAALFRTAAFVFEKIVYAEATTKKIYVIPKRRFNTEYLVSSPQNLLKAGLFMRLSDIARSDISSSARCILFGEATAVAFHILRATEETLKLYYYEHKKTKRLAKPMWGPMLSELRAKKSNVPPKVLLDSLDMVRASYRNPTQHPDALYDIEAAQDLFGVCLDLIGKMASSLPDRI